MEPWPRPSEGKNEAMSMTLSCCVPAQATNAGAHLASVASVDHRNSLLAGERVDVNLVGIPAAMALLFRLRKLRQQQVVALLPKRR